jgi:serine/threonine-protein kinase
MLDESKSLAPGDVVAGRFRIEELLGQGGFGAVYRATQLNLDRPVALKMLLPEAVGNEEAFARFRREAELAQKLQHPNTVRLYDFGETDEGLPFIAWELLRGHPLDAVLREDGALPALRVARIASQILKALMEAHALGIVHRDIKPSNIFLCEFSGERDFVKVLDFGIAKNVRGGKAITMVGSILGTPSYMAPEQLRGAEVSPASDVYALGLVMAEALSGQPAYGPVIGASLVMAQLSDTPAPVPASVKTSPLGPIILRAIQKRPEARYPDAAAMMAQLEPVLASLAPEQPGRGPASFASAPTVLAYAPDRGAGPTSGVVLGYAPPTATPSPEQAPPLAPTVVAPPTANVGPAHAPLANAPTVVAPQALNASPAPAGVARMPAEDLGQTPYKGTVPMWRSPTPRPGPALRAPILAGAAADASIPAPKAPMMDAAGPAMPPPAAPPAPLAAPPPAPAPAAAPTRPLAAPSSRRSLIVGIFAGAAFMLVVLILVALALKLIRIRTEREGHEGHEGHPPTPPHHPQH